MIEKSQGNTQTNKKEKEHSKISKCAERREKSFVYQISRKKVLCLGNVDTK